VTRTPLVRFDRGDGPAARVTLGHPARHNALTPELLDDLRAALQRVQESDARLMVIAGEGRSFSTGGDIAEFVARADDPERLRDYAERIVQALNDAILDLLRLPIPVVARVQGATTGGAIGLVLASDIVLMTPDAFLQPYYGVVGFAPDGGWTALLPERIGASRSIAAQALNRRIEASEALRLGIADEIALPDELEGRIAVHSATIATQSRGTLAATRALVWDEARLRVVEGRLDAEKGAFVARVALPQVIAGIRGFVGQRSRNAG
jgi:2-(1,2-epoxy-1,2-dihydrophenyl)acetyl-CoA isomerase